MLRSTAATRRTIRHQEGLFGTADSSFPTTEEILWGKRFLFKSQGICFLKTGFGLEPDRMDVLDPGRKSQPKY